LCGCTKIYRKILPAQNSRHNNANEWELQSQEYLLQHNKLANLLLALAHPFCIAII